MFLSFNPPKRQPRTLVIGAMILDVLAMASRQAKPEDSTPGLVTTSAGGVALNIAEGLARLGIGTTLVSITGDDEAARQLLAHCGAAGINTTPVIRDSKARTSSYVSLHNVDGSLLYAVADAGLIEELSAGVLPALPDMLQNADVCVIDANLPVELINHIAIIKKDVPLVAEAVSITKCQKLQGILSGLQLLKVNRHEAVALSGLGRSAALDEVAGSLLSTGLNSVLITLGGSGAMLATLQRGRLVTHSCEAPDVEIKSVNGAGDALLAGFLSAALYGKDPQQQLRWGKVAAGFSLGVDRACSPDISVAAMGSLEN